MEPDRNDELIAGYALGALSAEEERELDEHLRRNPGAREQLAALQETAASLAYGVEAPAPPPGLRTRIVEGVHRSPPANVVPLRRRWLVPALAAAAAVAAGVAIGLGVWASGLSSSLSDERAASAHQAEVLALASSPGASRYAVRGAGGGTLVVARDGRAGLVLTGLDPAPAGKTYQVWVIEGGKPASAGLFGGGGGVQSVVALSRRVPQGSTVAVTVEKAGGAPAPTTEPIASAPTA